MIKTDAEQVKSWLKRNARLPLLALGGFALGLVVVAGILTVMPDGSPNDLNKIETASGASAPVTTAEPKKDDAKAGGFKKLLSGKKDSGPKTPPPSVRVAPVAQKSVAPELTSVGNVIPNQSVAVSARINSQITEVKFNAGDDVKAGQVLFVLDAREVAAALSQARAKLAGDQAQLVALKKELDRQQLGVSKGFSSKSGLDVAQAQYASGQALVESDQALVESLEAQESYTVITAPIDGRTGTINYTLGNIVRSNDTVPLVTINQIMPIAVQASLPQNSVDAVRAAMRGGTVRATATTNSGKTVQGTLQYIDNAIDIASGTYVARAIFENTDETLYPGTLVNLSIALGQDKPQLTIPEVAVQHDQKGDTFVYVIDTQNVARLTMVKVIRIQDGQALIGEGLSGGENVAIDGMMSIKDNGPVIINAGPETRADEDPSEQPEMP
jgi:multidrug efflux system membrane fusion protein